MWDLAVREEDYEAADAFARRYHGTPPLSMRLLVALARGDSAAKAELLAEARQAENRQLQIAARFVATYLGDLVLAEELARLDLQWRRGPPLRADAQLLLGWLELARGRWSGARAEFTQAARMEGAVDVPVHRAIGATLPLLAVPRADLVAIRDEVLRWNGSAPGGPPGLALALRPHLRLYLLGLLSSRLGDEDAARRYAGELERHPAPAPGAAIGRDLARTVRADVAWRRQRPAEVLAIVDSLEVHVPLELVAVPRFVNLRGYTHEHARYLRAAALQAVGEDREALRWLQTGFLGAPNEFAYFAPLHLGRGEIYQRLSEPEKAAEEYARLVKLWEACDPELRAVVDDVRGRLGRLTAGGDVPGR
ncbi:MAG: hypothetical protein HYW06_03770 [Gemmatimonadetes bacterium]|nr:hypothetical protein [Gemmatimonadota bacterium]MBI2403581.1 hypothetical protein [Gemmatimonadota bacterium]MBI2536081.1 hypothetical protein [Gemmatimonadota bacterium]